MFQKRAIIILILAMLMSITYIFAIDAYDSMPQQIKWLNEKIYLEEVNYNEIGIELKGIKYNEILTPEEVAGRQEEMIQNLSHEPDCSKLCQIHHIADSSKALSVEEGSIVAETMKSGLNGNYEFTIKNQQDIHRNTYYDLKIKGSHNIEKLDTLRNWGRMTLEKWKVSIEETIYFKGSMAGTLDKVEREELQREVFTNLKAKDTNFYEDDLCETTCAYYGYTSHIKAFIEEENGQKTNVQMSFKYDELTDSTEVIVAFPFYNEPF